MGLFLFSLLPRHGTAQGAADFRKLDRHARRAPQPVSLDVKSLSRYLTEPAANDMEKARALYVWLTHNIEYDSEAIARDEGRINQRLDDILRRRRAICTGYAQLLEALCAEAGLRCPEISGYSKGTLTARPGLKVPDHAWNAILLDGEWHLVDATWGSSVIDRDNDFVTSDSAFYWLTPPRSFIRNHLPAQPWWQLLPCPVPPAVFQEPADSIGGWLDKRDSCYAFRDSITAYLSLPLPQRGLAKAEAAYRFNPTPLNANELGHASIDYATRLSDRADSLQLLGEMDVFLEVQTEILSACARARQYAEKLYPWQQELCIGTTLNQAVAYAQQGETDRAVELLENVKAQIVELPEGSLYAKQMETMVRRYLEQLR